MSGPIILDVSRLLSRAARRVPTGIDRVEHAYADGLRRAVPDRLRYAAVNQLGRFRHLPTGRTRAFVEQTGLEWRTAMRMGPDADAGPGKAEGVRVGPNALLASARRLQAGIMLPNTMPRFVSRRAGHAGRPTYLLVSHHHLHQPKAIERATSQLGAAFVCFIHDLIPIEFPEYGRPLEAEKHRRRIETAVRFADAFVVNSVSTRDALLPFLRQGGREVPVLVAPLGVHELPAPRATAAAEVGHPYFLYIGTIEPRKNHLLLLHIWRRLALEMGERTPRLVLVGQRGWENEMVIDVLERSEILRDCVVEHNALPDEQVQALIAGARAVLLPSFAEGYGLPVAEALAAGTPVLCSDLPALHEVGGAAPEFLDPLDGLAWMRAIRDYGGEPSGRRDAQLARIAAWSPPGWSSHMEGVLQMISTLPEK